jgi:hypothetical protein
VASGCEKGNPQAVIIIERIKTKNVNVKSLLNWFMGKSFFEENIYPLYKQAAHVGDSFV